MQKVRRVGNYVNFRHKNIGVELSQKMEANLLYTELLLSIAKNLI